VIVVSDSGPLHYLIQINKVDLLHSLFGKVVIPGAVREELMCPNAPNIAQIDKFTQFHVRARRRRFLFRVPG
jgi:predicted nucleic acid-binding protein